MTGATPWLNRSVEPGSTARQQRSARFTLAVGGVWDHGAVPIASWLTELPTAPTVAPDVLGELRRDLESAARVAVSVCEEAGAGLLEPGALEPSALRLPKSRLVELERCERSAVASADHDEPSTMSATLLRGVALDRFVTHQLRAGRVREPVQDLAAMLLAEGEWELLAALDEMLDDDPDATEGLLAPLASAVADAWSAVPSEWMARTQSRASLGFAEARVVCSGVVDVELGGVPTGRPSIVVEVKSGAPTGTHLAEAAYYGLLVALRDGVAPSHVARWYPGGSIVPMAVTEGLLESAARRLADGMVAWAQLLAGRPPKENAGPWCAWCPDSDRCPSARTGSDDLETASA